MNRTRVPRDREPGADRSRRRAEVTSPAGALERHLDRAVPPALSKRGRAFLMVSKGQAVGTVFPLTQDRVIIGRSRDAEISLNEQAISQEHARLSLAPGGYFSIEDLGSTNGTRVNGQRIAGRVRLRSGDSIRTGSCTFTYVSKSDDAEPPGTLKLPSEPEPALQVAHAAVAIAHGRDDDDEGVSLTQVVHTVKVSWVYFKRYAWLAATGLFFGIAAGVAQSRLNPPPGSAWFEMTLTAGARGSEENGIEFFVAPESTFRSLPLIKKTLSDLGHPNATDADASDVQSFLSFEQVGYQSKLWRGDYQDATSEGAALFLKTHVDSYVSSEMDKILRLLRDDEQFNQEQVKQAGAALEEAKAQLLTFIDQNPKAVPKDARAQLETSPTLATPTNLTELVGARQRELDAAIAQLKRRKAEPYQAQAAEAEREIALELGRGKTEQHPDVKAARNRARQMKEQAQKVMRTAPSKADEEMDPAVSAARRALAAAKARQAKQGAIGPETPTVTPVEKPKNLAQASLVYRELSERYERAQAEFAKWSEKLKSTERKLDREETAAKSRYDVITPPTPEQVSMTRVTVKRAGLGGAVGLLLALVAAACLEIRRQLVARGLL